MKNYLRPIMLVVLSLLLVSCNSEKQFTQEKNNITNITAPDGTEYVYFAAEGQVYTFGLDTFLGKIKGEKQSKFYQKLGIINGMYSCEGDADLNILMRVAPWDEFQLYYRKASLPEIDLSPDNCVRFELIRWEELDFYRADIRHMSCNEGITDPEEIRAFLSDLRSQKSPEEAGLYDLVRKPDGLFENCYVLGIIYGYFKDAVNLAIPFQVTSYNDEAYSIRFTGEDYDEDGRWYDYAYEYVLPEKWLDALQAK